MPTGPLAEAPLVAPSFRSRAARLIAGLVFFAIGIWALELIPRGPREFAYGPFGVRYGNLAPLPFAAFNGFTPEQLSSHLARLVFFTPAVLLIGSSVGPFALAALRRWRVRRTWLALFGAVAVAVIAASVTEGVPLQDDEATYRMQADLLRSGRLADASLPGIEWGEPFTVFTERGATGKYLFGGPLVLALGGLVGFPLLAHVVLVFFTLWFVHAGGKRSPDASGDEDSARFLGTALLALSPAFLFTSATALSQTPALFGLAVAVWALSVPGLRGGAMAGVALGFALTCRPQLAVPCGGVLLLMQARHDRRWIVGAILAASPWVIAIALYNRALTGDPFKLPWSGYFDERYGFGRPFPSADPGAYEHTPVRALLLAGVQLLRLNGWALGWPVSLAGPIAWFALGRPHRQLVSPWALVALATFVFQLGYYGLGSSDTGPVYHHAVLPFFALSTGAALVHLLGSERRAQLAAGVLVACLVLGTGSFLLEHGARLRNLSERIAAPFRGLQENRNPVLLFADDSRRRPMTGWVMGIPFRDRCAECRVVQFPFQDVETANKIAAAMPSRECLYLAYDWSERGYRLDSCTGIAERRRALDAAQQEHQRRGPEWALDGLRAWHVDGRWREAFPWVPFW